MATRDGAPIDLVWLETDLTEVRSVELSSALGVRHKARVPNAELSVNANADGTRGLIKVAASEGDLTSRISATVRAGVVRVFTEADHDEAVALVTSPAWLGSRA